MTPRLFCRAWLQIFVCCVIIRSGSTQESFKALHGSRDTVATETLGTSACAGGVGISSPKGIIKSLAWSKKDRPFKPTECVWIIRAPPGKIIRIDKMHLPRICNEFNFTISDYQNPNAGVLPSLLYSQSFRWCELNDWEIEKLDRDTVYSHTNGVIVRLVAIEEDYGSPKKEFSAMNLTYTAVDPHPGCYNDNSELITTSGGHRTSPYLEKLKDKTISDARCSWQIVAPKGHVVVLRWTRFWLSLWMDCEDDAVTVRDGGPEAEVAATLCGRIPPRTFTSSGRSLTVGFTSDRSEMAWGAFNFTWTFVKKRSMPRWHPGCGRRRVVLKDPSGVFTAPMVRGTFEYPKNAKCSWLIKQPKGTLVQLYLEIFSLEESANCSKDSLSVYDSSRPKARYLQKRICGDGPKGTYILGRGNVLLVTFNTDSTNSSMGFRIMYRHRTTVPCGIPAHTPTVWPNVDPTFKPKISQKSKEKRSTMLSRVRRMINAEEAVPHSWPWELLVAARNKALCAAILVHRRWVVTVASCVRIQWLYSMEPNEFSVIAGLHNRTNARARGQQEVKVKHIFSHRGHSFFTTANDLALLELEEDIVFNDKVSPVCLPLEPLGPRPTCVFAGWGQTRGTGSRKVIRQRTATIIPQRVCSRKKWWSHRSNDYIICVGERHTGYQITCDGDGGAPLSCREHGRWVLHGLSSTASRSKTCREKRKPSIATRIEKYTDWIEKVSHGDVMAPRLWTRNVVLG